MSKIKWDKEICKNIANTYTNIKNFRKEQINLYNIIKKING